MKGYNLNFEEALLKLASFSCVQPGCTFKSDNKQDFVYTLDGNPPGLYCQEHAGYCANCGHGVAFNAGKHPNHVATSAPVDKTSGVICNRCANQCKICGKIDYNNELTDERGHKICEDCWEEAYFECPQCKEVKPLESLMEEKRRKNSLNQEDLDYGCTDCMADCENSRCPIVNLKEKMLEGPDNNYYCEDCFSESFTTCEECNQTLWSEDAHYGGDGSYCEQCYNEKFGNCHECGETFPRNELKEDESDGYEYCEDCFKGKTALPPEYESLVNVPVRFNKHTRALTQLKKLLPISVKELKTKNMALANSLKDLIIFSKGRDLTPEVVAEFEEGLDTDEYPIEFTTWRSPQQRSVKSKVPQLVLNIIASPEVLDEMRRDGSYNLFEKINETSKESGHPMVEDQLGWARVELHPSEKYLLIDEIQADHLNAIDRINNENYQGRSYKDHIKSRYDLTEEQWQTICQNLKKHLKDFSDIAIQAVRNFATANGYTKIFYHTYESGKQLKRNAPPKSMYTEVPKKNMFLPSPEKPFGLEGNFLSREARSKLLRFINARLVKKNS